MPVDLQSGKTFGELCTAFAERIGIADYSAGAAATPTDSHDEDLCRRMVNDGYRRFIKHDIHWTFRRLWIELAFDAEGDGPLNIDGDADRYAMPPYINGAPSGPWIYDDDAAVAGEICERPYEWVRLQRDDSGGTTGYPRYFGWTRVKTASSPGIRPNAVEFLFYPCPAEALTVRAPFHVSPYDLVDFQERHVAGQEHDDAIIAWAVECFRERPEENPAEYERARSARADCVSASHRLDAALRTRNRGQMTDPSAQRPIPITTNSRLGALYRNGTLIN